MKYKKVKLFLLTILISSFTSCSEDGKVELDSFSFSNNSINLNIKSNKYSSFAIYSKSKSSESYAFKKNIFNNTYSYTNPNLDIKVVPLVNNKEINDDASEFNYFSNTLNCENIIVFDDSLSSSYMNNIVDEHYEELSRWEWSKKRYTFLLLEGNYEDLVVKNGYYTSFLGLGEVPTDVSVKKLETLNHPSTGNALINFWRSNENFHVKEDSTWAISQASPLRRMAFSKGLALSCFEPEKENWSSGGFISNTLVSGVINSGTQQQFYIRNSKIHEYSHANFNMVFEGVSADYLPHGDSWEQIHSTIIDNAYIVREKPHLIYDVNQGLGIRIYEDKNDSKSITWDVDEQASFIPLDQCYIAHEDDSADKIQSEYNKGKQLLFTPGIYHIDKSINLNRANSVVLGLGFPTLICDNESNVFNISVKGVSMASILLQAGSHSESLLDISSANGENRTVLNDVFFRVGGEDITPTFVETCLNVDQEDVILDHFWIWRADHGATSQCIGWDYNVSNQGIIINADNVVAHCLMVEHFEKYQTLWKGDNGLLVFYQSETPYDAMRQQQWQRDDSESGMGYASYKVADTVSTHRAIGIGVYYYQKAPIPIYCYSGIESPSGNNISLSHMVIRYFGGQGHIINTINEVQGDKDPSGEKCLMLDHFPI